MLARPHPCIGWLLISPDDTRRVMDRLLRERDTALDADPSFSGMPQAFIDWTWETWLPNHINRYKAQIEEHIHYLDHKIGELNLEAEKLAGGVLENRDAVAELRDRLKREIEVRELVA